MKQVLVILSLLVAISSCSKAEDETNFDLSKASKRWDATEKTWNEDALRALEQGRYIYRKNCAACHGKGGTGDNTIGAPSLVNNAIIKGDISYHLSLIKNGKGQMPAFSQVLTDDEILSVAAFERNAWGNHDYGVFNQLAE